MATYSKDFIVKNGLQVGGTTLRVGDIILKDMADGTMNVYEDDGTTLAAIITPSANVSYDNTASGLSATNVKAALDELKTSITNQDQASEISYSGTSSGLSAATVQAAIDEIVSEQDGNTKTLLAALDSNIIPSADITYDLGSPTKQWRDLYIGPGSLYLNGTKVLEDDSGTLNFTADSNQSMTLQTSGTGQTDITSAAGVNLTTTGTGSDISLTADGNIEVNSDLLMLAGKNINTSDGNAVGFSVDANFGANSIIATTVTANLTGNVTGTVSSLSNHDTDDVTEGSTNLYYTDARAQAAISTDSTLSYSSGQVSMPSSGVTAGSYGAAAAVPVITIDAQGRITSASTTAVAGVSSVSYTSSTGVLQIDTSDGSSYTEDLGVGTGDSPTFAGLTVNGNLTVSGTTTTVNTETINLADNVILLNSNATGTPSENGGIEIERGDSTNKTLIWDEANDRWTVGSESFVAGTFIGALTGNVTGDLTGDVTGNADTASAWATARTLSLTGAVTGSASVDGSGNVSLATTATSDPTLTLTGDASGSATFTNLGNATLTVTVADDSHNHVTSNIDGLAEYISDTVGAMVSSNSESGISVTYQDSDNTLDFNVNDPTITLTGAVTGSATMTNLGNVSIATTATADPTLTINGDASGSATFTNLGNATLTLTIADDSHNHTTSNIDNFTESVQDIIGGMVSSNTETGIGVTYNDSTGKLNFSVTASGIITAGSNLSLSGSTLNVSSSPTFSGTVTAADFNSTSDQRLKTDVETIANSRSKVSALRGVNFNWKRSNEYAMGVIAQEVEEVIPEVVATDSEGMKSVNYQAMVGLLIEAVKDLQAQIDDLKNNK